MFQRIPFCSLDTIWGSDKPTVMSGTFRLEISHLVTLDSIQSQWKWTSPSTGLISLPQVVLPLLPIILGQSESRLAWRLDTRQRSCFTSGMLQRSALDITPSAYSLATRDVAHVSHGVIFNDVNEADTGQQHRNETVKDWSLKWYFQTNFTNCHRLPSQIESGWVKAKIFCRFWAKNISAAISKALSP